MKIITFALSAVMAMTIAGNCNMTASAETIKYDYGTVEVPLNHDMFEQNSNGYHSDIARLASSLSECAYDGNNLNNAYQSLGFDLKNDVALFGYAGQANNALYETDLIDSYEDSLAFSVATKKLDDTQLLIVTLRGTSLNSASDILHDISIFGLDFYKSTAPAGFVNFFRKTSIGMSLFIENHPEIKEASDNGNLKILVTGHSLGGAGTNLLGAYLDTHDDNNYTGFFDNEEVKFMYNEILNIPQEDIFVYSFACPNAYYGDPTVADCDNIINLINESDFITDIPDGNKFGQFVYFDSGDKRGIAGHFGYKYINAIEKDIPDGVRYYGGAVDAEITADMFRQDSHEYHKDIAEVAVALCASSYNGKRDSGYYINSAYRQLGFKSENIEIYGYPSDEYSYSIASRQADDMTLLAVTLKGNSGKSDFYDQLKKYRTKSFMNSMTNPDYYDFYSRVKDSLDEYIESHKEILNSAQDGKLKVLISGHSIGGASASMLGASLNTPDSTLKIPDDDIFVYTFACPAVYSSTVECDNIINIMNENDMTTLSPFGVKSGKTVTFNYGTFSEACYEPKIYAENLPDTANYTTYQQIRINNPSAQYDILKDNEIIDKSEIKIISEENYTYIYIPDGNYKINFTGDSKETLEIYYTSQAGADILYNNISLAKNKYIEYNIHKRRLFVNNKNGKHIKYIAKNGRETIIESTDAPEYTEEFLDKKAIAAASGVLVVVILSGIFISKKKKET